MDQFRPYLRGLMLLGVVGCSASAAVVPPTGAERAPNPSVGFRVAIGVAATLRTSCPAEWSVRSEGAALHRGVSARGKVRCGSVPPRGVVRFRV